MRVTPSRSLKAVFLASLIVTGEAGVGAEQASSDASQEIPDRREFPVNPNVSPCENFYEYACSNVISSFKLREDRSSHTFAFSDSRERILNKKKTFLKDLLKKQEGGPALPERSQTLATVYGACMNQDARKKEELELVKNTVATVTAIKTRDAFLDFLAQRRDSAQFSFVDVGSTANQDKPEIYDFLFAADMMSLPERSYYLKTEVRQDYLKTIEAFFRTIHDKNPIARAQKVLDLETAFAKNYPLPAELREIYSRKSSISKADILKKYPSFRLEQPLSKVPDSANIRHIIPDNYAFVDRVLRTEPLDNLKALYLFQNLSSLMDDGYPEYFQTRFAFRQKHLGEPKLRPEREERCTQLVMRSFNKELDAEVLPLMFPDFPEEKFIDLAESVRASIINGVRNNTWLSEEGKKGAIDKMSKAKLQLVKPRNDDEWYFNPKAVYDSLHPIANSIKLDQALNERMYKELAKERNRDRWGMGPLTVNAYYSPNDNKFVMPIGILQYPFYEPSLPLTVNLGAVGTVIGHELGHGIDDQGAKYDSEGKLRQWMSNEDIANFKSRGRKFVEQFNQIGHDGELTLGENIGDLTGVTFSFQAAFPGGKGEIEDKQNFFLQYGRVWCGVELPKLAEQLLKTDPHSRGWARVNQQLKNQPEFAAAFSCRKDDPMVLPESEIVRIW